MLTISVKNFGPIAEGSVDLKPLTIFVGPSNTGKSYMATAVYAVMQCVAQLGAPSPPNIWGQRSVRMSFRAFPDTKASREVLGELQTWLQQQSHGSSEPADLKVASLPAGYRSWLEKEVALQLTNFQDSVINQLSQIHGESSQFIRLGNEPDRFSLNIQQDIPCLDLEIQRINGASLQPTFDITQFSLPDFWLDLQLEQFEYDRKRRMLAEVTMELVDSATKRMVAPIPKQSYYLPAARSGIVQGHKVLSAAVVRQSSQVGIREFNVPLLPAITAEFLSYLIGLGQQMRLLESKGALDLATRFIETVVLSGEIDLDESAGLPFPDISYETSTGKFTLNQSSSMVSELAPLVLFLKYIIHEGDLLILEEPESHLHPAAQRQLARGIVRLVNAGVKVLITTHSETFVSQINHLLRISYASKRWLKDHDFEPEDCITHDQVGAYQFAWDEEQGGSVVKPLEVHKDIGIDEAEFIGVIDSLYEESLLVQRIRVKG